jgi:hypothetical protein
MLGRLARWLRLLGYDTLYDRRWDDAELARVAAREQRVLLTRDHALLRRRIVRRGLLVDEDDPDRQLRFVVAELGLTRDPKRLFTRCLHCNTPVEPVAADDVRGEVPPYVLRHCDRFARCPGCGRVYWNGTHQQLARQRLADIL